MAIFGSVLIAYLIVSVTVAVILRGLRVAVVWMFEITEYCILWITFLAAPWVLSEEGHIKMDLLLGSFSPQVRTSLNIITSIIGALTCLILTGFSIKVTWDYFRSGYFLHTVLAPPIYPILVIVPIGCFVLFIQFIRRTQKYMRRDL